MQYSENVAWNQKIVVDRLINIICRFRSVNFQGHNENEQSCNKGNINLLPMDVFYDEHMETSTVFTHTSSKILNSLILWMKKLLWNKPSWCVC